MKRLRYLGFLAAALLAHVTGAWGANSYSIFIPGGALGGTWNSQTVNLSAGPSFLLGITPVASGGTGDSTLAAHAILVGEGTSPVATVGPMAVDTVLQGQGASADPASVAVVNCGDATHALAYSTSTHTFSCQLVTGSGGGSPGGSTTQVQFNLSGSFAGDAGFTYVGSTTQTVTLGTSSNGPTIQAAAGSATGQPTNINGSTAGATSTGGLINITGGTGGATNGAGGAINIKGGVGATSGPGGAATLIGGAGVGTTNGGGTANVTGGAGATSGPGGTVVITGGAGGATTGVGGAVSMTGGAATAGNNAGGNATLKGGNSTGTGTAGSAIVQGGTVGTTIPNGYENVQILGGTTSVAITNGIGANVNTASIAIIGSAPGTAAQNGSDVLVFGGGGGGNAGTVGGNVVMRTGAALVAGGNGKLLLQGVNTGTGNPTTFYQMDGNTGAWSGGWIAGGTISVSGCSLSAATGGQNAGKFTSGTTGTCTVTITLPSAPTGWTCYANDITTKANIPQSATTNASCTISGATTSGDTVTFMAMGW